MTGCSPEDSYRYLHSPERYGETGSPAESFNPSLPSQACYCSSWDFFSRCWPTKNLNNEYDEEKNNNKENNLETSDETDDPAKTVVVEKEKRKRLLRWERLKSDRERVDADCEVFEGILGNGSAAFYPSYNLEFQTFTWALTATLNIIALSHDDPRPPSTVTKEKDKGRRHDITTYSTYCDMQSSYYIPSVDAVWKEAQPSSIWSASTA